MDLSFKTVDEFIATFPQETQLLLEQVRAAIRRAAPQADEGIAYGMAGYKVAGRPLVYFSAFKNHIGFYATPSGHSVFAAELSKYKQGKGSVQFPIDEPLPLDLIYRITVFRVEENLKK